MCYVDEDWFQQQARRHASHAEGVSRRNFLAGGLLTGLAAAADLGVSLLMPGTAEGAEMPGKSGGPGATDANFKWFGTDGWEISFGKRTILFDPWFERIHTGFFEGKFDAKTPLKVSESLIDEHVKKADHILIGHGHWDHIMDIPYIAKKTGAMVIGSETHGNIMRAYGVPEGQIVHVKGGENMQFDGYTIEVFPGLHSMGPTKKHAVPGHRISVPAMPTTVGELPEGDSLCYLITIGGKFRVFLMSTANYVERAISGLKPDVALIASIFANQIHDFTPRLLKALNHPRLILPTHWDNFERPYSEELRDLRDVFGDPGNLDLWVKEVKQHSPKSKVVVMKFFESYAL
jgi:L-ascorbate metabolism protein UlaG (beta-lactamase superfamily)